MEKIAKESINEIKDTILDTTKKITKTIDTRIKNPFVFSYIISLILINWIPISIFFKSELNIYQIINSIEKNEYKYDNYKSYVYPLLIATAYTFLLPFVEGLRSLILDLVENLKLYSTTIQLKNFQKKQLLEIGKSDHIKRNSLSNTILELERKNKDLENKVDTFILELETSKIKLTGALEKNQFLNGSQMQNKIIIEDLQKEKQNLKNEKKVIEKVLLESNSLIDKWQIEIGEKFEKDNHSKNNLIERQAEVGVEYVKDNKFRSDYLKFKKSNIFQYFKKIIENIEKTGYFPKNTNKMIKDEYIQLGIIAIRREANGLNTYKLTEKCINYRAQIVIDNYDS